MRRVHVIGVPGSGKSTLAQRLASGLGVPVFDLDFVGYDNGVGLERPLDVRLADVARIAALPGWVTEGSFVGWTDGILREADWIVWLDVPRRVALWRVVKRHVAGTLRRNNRHAGWRKLVRFLRFVHSSYGPSRMEKQEALMPYSAKVRRVTRGSPRRVERLAFACGGEGKLGGF